MTSNKASVGPMDPATVALFLDVSERLGYAVLPKGDEYVAVPWTEKACDPEVLVRLLAALGSAKQDPGEPQENPWGRETYTIPMSPQTSVTLSVMPKAHAIEGLDRDTAEGVEKAVTAQPSYNDVVQALSEVLDCVDETWFDYPAISRAREVLRATRAPESKNRG